MGPRPFLEAAALLQTHLLQIFLENTDNIQTSDEFFLNVGQLCAVKDQNTELLCWGKHQRCPRSFLARAGAGSYSPALRSEPFLVRTLSKLCFVLRLVETKMKEALCGDECESLLQVPQC
ncbi:hypothetical protein Y1Q_0010265 [Alligator mississippiensis]|uniref:Uncharacterized protein n=1 Tax=Alligator mississippiensis TaxID=8496 RepID=A0A151MRL2_ALLMI|nr:hypothetical protein Y1Q_0010265 [Alligator mississippiensis]